MSRQRALAGGLFLLVVAILWSAGAVVGDETGPARTTIDWLLAAGWWAFAYMHVAHAIFNTTGQAKGSEGQA